MRDREKRCSECLQLQKEEMEESLKDYEFTCKSNIYSLWMEGLKNDFKDLPKEPTKELQ